ncbi:putative ribonuclease H-like domain-containing protein [Tanacetum coccineum]
MVENPSASNLLQQELVQIHEDDIKEIALKVASLSLSVRAKKFFSEDKKEYISSMVMTLQSDMAKEQVQTNMALMAFSDSECDELLVKLNESDFKATTYKRGLATLEEQLVKFRKNEVLFGEEIVVLKREIGCKDYELGVLKTEYEKVMQEKEGIDYKISKFDNASKNLDKLLESQITDKSKKGLGYHVVSPPHPLTLNAPTRLDLSYSGLDEFKEPEFNGYEQVSEEEISSVESTPNVVKETVFHTTKKVDFVKSKKNEKPVRQSVRYAEMYRSQSLRGNQRNWNGLKSNQLGILTPCFPQKYDSKSSFAENSLKPLSTARPVYTAHPKPTVHSAKPMTHFSKQAQSTVQEPFYKRPTLTNRYINTVRPRVVNTARTYIGPVNTVREKGVNVVKPSACWVWRHTRPNGASLGNPQMNDKGFKFDGGYVTFGGGAYGGRITGKGTLKTNNLDFEDVYFVNELKFNLFSFSRMCDKKNYVLFTDTKCLALSPDFKLPDENQILLRIPRKDNMYSFDMQNIVPKENLTCLVAKATTDESMLWHRRLGHINFKNINKLVKENLVRGLPLKHSENDQTCVACLKGKQHKASCKTKILNPITKPLFMLYMDLFGLTFVSSIMHKKYCLVITDDYSRFTWVFFLATKDETSEILKNFIKEIENLVDKKVKIIRYDNRTELKNKVMDDFCKEKGTISNESAGIQEDLNAGTFSRQKGSIKDCIVMPIWKDASYFDSSTMNVNDGEPKSFADNPNPGVNIVSPVVNSIISPVNTASPKDMLGADHTLEAAHTEIINDSDEPEVELGNILSSYIVPTTPYTRINKDHPLDNVIGDIQSSVQIRRSTSQQGFLSAVYEEKTHEDLHTCLFSCFLSQEEPKRVSKALSDSAWVEAMQEELLQFKLQKVWILVDLPKGKRPIGVKWIFKNKTDERGIVIRNKERLVAQGHTQEEGIDYDDSAFLYGTIEEEVYVCQPPGFEDPDFPDKVYKVVTALYGLHQAPRAWYETLAKYLLDNGFQRGKIDPTLFIKRQKGEILLVQVYVDDIIFGSTKKEMCNEFEKFMKDKFQMSSMGELTFFLGLQSASTPIDLKKPLVKDGDADDVDVHLYRSMIGSLMYLITSRPDIMFAVCACARFQVTPKTSHLIAVKRIFRYLKGKPTLGLWYPRDSPFELVAYSDSDYGGAIQDRKSTTKGCQFLGNRLISWQCKKQSVVATSTTEAEYVAAASCCGQVLWIQNQLLDYMYNFMNTVIHIDNNSIICIIENPVKHQKTKHIEIRSSYKRGRDTKVPQSGGPLLKVGDEAVHKELGDRIERAATTASSKDAEQDSIAALSTTKEGVQAITATINGREKTITEVSLRRHLKLEDSEGIYSMANEEIFAQLTNIGVITPLFATMLIQPQVLEKDLQQTKKTYSTSLTKLILRVKKLENLLKSGRARRKARIVLFEDEEAPEDSSKQGRKISEIDADPNISLVQEDAQVQEKQSDDTEVLIEEETLTELFEDPRSSKKEVTTFANYQIYIRKRRGANTGSSGLSTAGRQVSTADISTISEIDAAAAERAKDKGKAIMTESDPIKKLKKKVQVQLTVDEELARKIQEEDQARAIAEQEQERLNFEAALEIQKQFDERQEVVDEPNQTQSIDWNDPSVLRYHALKLKHVLKAQARKNMCVYLKNQRGYKMKDFKGMTYDDIRPIFEKVWDFNQNFMPMNSELEAQLLKRKGKKVQKESAETQKIETKPVEEEKVIVEEVKPKQIVKEVSKKSEGKRRKSLARKRVRETQDEETYKKQKFDEKEADDTEKEELNDYLDIVPRDEFALDIESLATKYPIVDWKTHALNEHFMYYQNFRADGSFKNYKIFSEMLDDFDRQDVEDLHRLVKEIYKTNQQDYNLISWRLCDSCGIHILLMNTGIAIHMMVEKKYPLTQEMLSKMLSRRLEVDHESIMAYELLKFIKSQNGNSWVSKPVTSQEGGTSVTKMTVLVTAEEKICNEATKKTHKALLKQQYENFNASSSESLDSIFNRLQKLISKLAILGVVITSDDLNLKFLRSLPGEWDTHVIVWMNKPDIKTMSIDDLYNNFKIVEQKVKKSVGASSSDQNMAFVTAPSTSSTNNVNTANSAAFEVSTGSTKVNTASPSISTASISDNTVYAFMVENPSGSNLLHQDLVQIHEDDIKEIDLKWHLSLLSVRAKKFFQRTGKKIFINGNDTAGYDKSKNYLKEQTLCKLKMAEQDIPPPTITAMKIPIIRKGEYDIWSMRMRQYISHTDHNLWDVIVNGDLEEEPAPTSGETSAPPAPKTAKQLAA